MSSADGRDGRGGSPVQGGSSDHSLETMLFESLVHHLIEKGLLTKDDALSVVQTVAEVKRAQVVADGASDGYNPNDELRVLRQLFDSFEAMRERARGRPLDGHNVHQLRPPLHDGNPQFPDDA